MISIVIDFNLHWIPSRKNLKTFEISRCLQISKSESEDDTTIKSPACKPNFRISKLQILQLAPTTPLLILWFIDLP